jgi:nicotinamide mononucleotide transporter
MNTIEIVAVVFSVISVLCSRQNSIWVYPTGLVSTFLFTWIYLQPGIGLYAEAGLNVYYFIMSVYGWIYWAYQKNQKNARAISLTTPTEKWIVAAIVVFGWLGIYMILINFTDSTVPILDSFVSATAWSGMWLLARRKVENWILLNVSNIVSIPLLWYKGLPLTALLTVFLFIVAVSGYFHWMKIYKKSVACES